MFLRKGLIFLTLALAALILVGLALAGDPIFSGLLRSYGPSAVGQPLEFENASLSILGGSAEVNELVIGGEKKLLVKIGRSAFDAAVGEAFGGRFHIEEATLDRVVLNLEIDKNGHFIFDPGPPPPEVVKEHGGDAPGPETVPAEERDLAQVVGDLWQRYQTYKEYYDKYGGVFGGGEESADGAAAEDSGRKALLGKPAYLQERAALAAAASEEPGPFWLSKAEISDFSWTTLDQRSGKPILPPIENGTISLHNIGSPPRVAEGEDPVGPATLHAEAAMVDGGNLLFTLEIPHLDQATRLQAQFIGLPAQSLSGALSSSLPYRLNGGLIDLATEGLQFTGDSLSGTVHLELRQAVLEPGPKAKPVLGVSPQEFCKFVNAAMQKEAIAFDFVLGGSPSDPTFSIQNATDLDDLILGALKAEATERVNEEIDKVKSDLEEKAGEKLDPLKDKAKEKLGGLFGGKDGG